MNQRQLAPSIVYICADDGEITGSGFYVDDRRILTCTQAVADALLFQSIPETLEEEFVRLEFPFIAKKQKNIARVIFWDPASHVAGLELVEAPPENAQAAWLMEVDDLSDHSVTAYGFSQKDKRGKWAVGRAQNLDPDNGWYQIEAVKDQDGRIQASYCGAPVWDNELDGIAGMVVLAERRSDVVAPFLIPTDKLAEAWPKLPAPKPLAKLHGTPELPRHHVPRPEVLQELKEIMLSEEKRPLVVSGESAWSGIGKTTTLSALSRDIHIRHAFPDGVYWLTLGQTPDLRVHQARLAEALSEGSDGVYYFDDIQEGREKLVQLLEGKKALIILDDVVKQEHAVAFDVQDTDYHTQVILISPNADLGADLGAADYTLAPLTDAQARTLMANWAGQPVEKMSDYGHQAAMICQNIPLALILCGGQVRDGVDWDELVISLLEAGMPEDVSDDENAPPPVSRFAEHPQEAVMRALFTVLDGLSSTDMAAYATLVPFADEALVPETAVFMLWDFLHETSRRDAHRLLKSFDDKGLLTIIGKAPQSRLAFHKMHKLYLREDIADIKATHKDLLNAYKKLCHESWSDGPDDGYFYNNLAQHLVAANRFKSLQKLLFDFEWLLATLNAGSSRSLIASYALLEACGEALPAHKKVGDALQGLARALAIREGNWADDLALALLELSDEGGDLSDLQEQAKKWRESAWLRPLRLKLPAKRRLRSPAGHTDRVNSIVITPDGNHAISASSDRTIKIWDLNGGSKPRTLQGHYWGITSVVITPDGKRIISGSWDNTLKAWDIETGEEIYTLRGHKHIIHALAITADGRYVASAALDKTAKLWDLKMEEELRTFGSYTPSSNAIAITPDASMVITDIHKTLQVWDAKTGETLQQLRGHVHLIAALTMMPDGENLISGSYDETIKIWNLESGQATHTFTGHKNRVNAIAVSNDGMYLASVSEDRTLKVWNVASGDVVATFKAGNPLSACAIAPDGLTIVAGDVDGRMHFLRLELPSETVID